jgi:hypothetical protein
MMIKGAMSFFLYVKSRGKGKKIDMKKKEGKKKEGIFFSVIIVLLKKKNEVSATKKYI